MNATDTEDRIRTGFAELLATLQAGLDERPRRIIRAPTAAELSAHYREYGLEFQPKASALPAEAAE
jgi:hypothetical protein